MSFLKFNIIAKCSTTKARACELELPHSTIETPVFMPVGTQGTLKGITSEQIEKLNCKLILGNTYHLGHRPGPELMEELGGLHKFMNWNRALLTDSGGFQMVSLVDFSKVTEEGVSFKSPHDGTTMLLTPELSMSIQKRIGADIIMQLDDVVASTLTGERVVQAMHRSIRWLDRCIEESKNYKNQNLFAIVQGGLDVELRSHCAKEMVKRNVPGFAIGGLSGGETHEEMWRMVTLTNNILPENKPRYLMGVGFALDMVISVALGCDMFDCVYPTRTARFGRALIRDGQVNLKSANYANDSRPIDSTCSCSTCLHYSRAFLHTVVSSEASACTLVSIHNIAFQLSLMAEIRESIIKDEYPKFIKKFVYDLFKDRKNIPQWVINSCESVNITFQ